MYKGLSHGRYFGWGGASDKWGGQLLTYSPNDFSNPDDFMKEVIEIDEAYKDKCLAKFNIENKYPENRITPVLFTKTGVWLSMLHRNFFHWFKIDKRKNVLVLSDCRIVRLESADKKNIDAVIYQEGGVEKKGVFDFYFLTAGAFESARILLSSEMAANDKVFFSDHLSQKMFRVYGSTVIGKEDFVFRLRGTSLITKRIIGEVDNVSYYLHPVFNMKFPFFEMVKEILFYKKFSFSKTGDYLVTTFKDIPHVAGFVWSMLAHRKMYVMNNEWDFYIDIENPTKDSFVSLSNEKDKYGLPGLDVHYNVGQEAVAIYEKAKQTSKEYLESCNVNFDVVAEKIDVQTCEDIYHPYGMFSFNSVDDYYSHWNNMLMISTGVLTRSGGINPTAALLPLVEDFVANRLKPVA